MCDKPVVKLVQHVRQAHNMSMDVYYDNETNKIENSEASEIETEDASGSDDESSSDEDESASDEDMSTREESDSDEAKQNFLSSC